MFTGIIEAIGTVRALTPKGGDVRVYIHTGKLDLSDVWKNTAAGNKLSF